MEIQTSSVCGACGGTGTLPTVEYNGFYHVITYTPCLQCCGKTTVAVPNAYYSVPTEVNNE